MIRKSLALASLLVVAACGPDAEDSPSDSATAADQGNDAVVSSAKVVVDANGLAIGRGQSREMPRFGTPRGEVDALLTTAFGAEPEKFTNSECGAGPTDFSRAGPLQVAYQDNRFVGWFVGEGEGVVTADGVQTGATIAELRDERPVQVIADSTLEGEFQYQSADYGMITGFFEGSETDGTITALAAGVTCFFR